MRVFRVLASAVLAASLILASGVRGAHSQVELPADEAAHPASKSERWEIAGHLRSPRDRTFGLLAAFRRGDHPALGKGSILTLAVVDVDGGLTYSDVNLISGPSAYPAPGPLKLDWEGSRLERLDGEGGLELVARGVDDRSRAPLAVSLSLKPVGSPSLAGDGGSRSLGYSENVAFQHTTSRMEAQGSLVLDEATYSVSGLVWFTHLWGPFQGTGKAFEGLTTWTAHLEDGRDLRIEAFRGVRKGGAFSAEALWFEDGTVRREALASPPEVTDRWRSIRGVSYPVAWRIPFADGELTCRARIPDGEVLYQLRLYLMNWTSLSWVGSCSLQGTVDGQPLRGDALVESTGYEPPK